MKKPFEFDDLKKRLEAQGLPAVEGLAEIAVKEVFDWAQESCAIHENALVQSLGGAAVATLRPMAMDQVDKIDGKEG